MRDRSLRQIAEFVHQETGIVVSAAREPALRAAVRKAAPQLDAAGFAGAMADPVRRRELVGRLIDEVTIRETTFVRDRGQLDAISWPALLGSAQAAGSQAAGSKTIRVWSAGCASGEEAYTLAMLADQAFAPARAPADVLGTDVSGAALAAAAAGRYHDRAVGGLALPERARYLERHSDGSHLVGQRLRGLVRFRPHNLANGPFPPSGETGFDLIVCRNVLIYFEQPLAVRVIEMLRRSLRPGGLLILGVADGLQLTMLPGPVPSAQPAAGSPAQPGLGSATQPPAWPFVQSSAGPTAQPPDGPALRRPLGRQPVPSREQRLELALAAAGQGDGGAALAQITPLLRGDPLDTEVHYVHGLILLGAADPAAAVLALRRALYADPAFALAAFTLGRAYDALGDETAACRAYQRALRTLDPDDHRYPLILRQIDPGDITAACRARLGQPDPEQPDPEQPDPEQPDPEQRAPEQRAPEQPAPDPDIA